MRKSLGLVAFLVMFSSVSLAATENPSRIKQVENLLRKKLPNLHFDKVEPSPIKGLYEVHAGSNIIYVDPQVEHLVFGAIYNLQGKNLTDEKRKQLFRQLADEMAKTFPVRSAVHVAGSKKPTVFLVADPDCPYSRGLLKFLLSRNVDFFVIFADMHRNSYPHILYILSSKDKRKAIEEVVSGKLDDEADVQRILKDASETDKKEVGDLLNEWKQWMGKYSIRGVPFAVIPGNQQVVQGFRREVFESLYPFDISKLNLSDAPVIVGSGSGKKIVAVTDPTCPFCKRACNALRHLAKEGKATFYVYLFPIHGDFSMKYIADIMNAPKEKRALLLEKFFEGKASPSGKPMTPEAKKEFQKQLQVINKLGVTGTPTFFSYPDGKKIVGANVRAIENLVKGGNK